MLYTPEKAEEMARVLNEKEREAAEYTGDPRDAWTYVVIHPPTGTKGLSFIEVRDENGEYVGTM